MSTLIFLMASLHSDALAKIFFFSFGCPTESPRISTAKSPSRNRMFEIIPETKLDSRYLIYAKIILVQNLLHSSADPYSPYGCIFYFYTIYILYFINIVLYYYLF